MWWRLAAFTAPLRYVARRTLRRIAELQVHHAALWEIDSGLQGWLAVVPLNWMML